jgi:hypothetical protein
MVASLINGFLKREEIMSALLEMIGALAVLASFVVRVSIYLDAGDTAAKKIRAP